MRRAFSSGSKTKEACETARSVSASNGRSGATTSTAPDAVSSPSRYGNRTTDRGVATSTQRGSAPADRRQPRGEHLRPDGPFTPSPAALSATSPSRAVRTSWGMSRPETISSTADLHRSSCGASSVFPLRCSSSQSGSPEAPDLDTHKVVDQRPDSMQEAGTLCKNAPRPNAPQQTIDLLERKIRARITTQAVPRASDSGLLVPIAAGQVQGIGAFGRGGRGIQ